MEKGWRGRMGKEGGKAEREKGREGGCTQGRLGTTKCRQGGRGGTSESGGRARGATNGGVRWRWKAITKGAGVRTSDVRDWRSSDSGVCRGVLAVGQTQSLSAIQRSSLQAPLLPM